MISVQSSVLLSGVTVSTTNGRGHTAEELAQRMADKIVYVGSNSHPAVRDQAIAFKASVQALCLFYLKEAVNQDRATIAHRLREAGYPDLINLLGE
jgi:hypothetical protein